MPEKYRKKGELSNMECFSVQGFANAAVNSAALATPPS
jgi:hypothetical protein